MGALFTSAKEASDVPCVCLFLGWFVSRITEKLQKVFPRNMKEVGSWPRIGLLTLSADKETEPGILFFRLCLILQDWRFLDIFVNQAYSGGWYL